MITATMPRSTERNHMSSLILVAIATAVVFAYTAVYLVRVVRDDRARQADGQADQWRASTEKSAGR